MSTIFDVAWASVDGAYRGFMNGYTLIVTELGDTWRGSVTVMSNGQPLPPLHSKDDLHSLDAAMDWCISVASIGTRSQGYVAAPGPKAVVIEGLLVCEHCGNAGQHSWQECAIKLRQECDVMRSNASRLKAAIRRQTVELPGDTPNGPVEEALHRLVQALSADSMKAFGWKAFAIANGWGAKLCGALASDNKELSEAAAAYFGEDFTKP